MHDKVIHQTERYKILIEKKIKVGGSPPVITFFKALVLLETEADNSVTLQL